MADATWKVNIEAPGKQVKSAADEVAKLEKKLRELQAPARMKQLEEQISSFGRAGKGALANIGRAIVAPLSLMHEFGGAIRENWTKMGEFLEYGGAIALAEGIKKVVEGIIDIGKEAVVSAAKAERMNRVIAIATGGEAQGAQTRGWLEKFSKTSEFTEAQNESAFVALKKVGFGQQQAGLVMKAAADVAAVSEDKNAAYNEAIAAFERVQTSGKVSARQLRPLGIGIEDLKTLSQFKGMNTKQLRKAMEQGNVNQGELFQLIMARTHETKLGQRSADNMNLLGTRMEKISELPERFWKKLADTRAIGQLSTALGGVLDKLDPESPAGAKIFSALEHAFGVVADTVANIDLGELAATITEDVIPAIESVIKFMGTLVGQVERVLRGFHEIHDAILGATPKSAALDAFDARQRKAAAAAAAEDEPSFLAKGTKIKSGVTAYHSPFHVVGQDAAAGAGLAAPAFEKTGADLGAAMEKGFRDKTGTHSPSLVFEELGAMVAAGFAGGVAGGKPSVDAAMDHTFGVPSEPIGGGGRGNTTLTLTISPTIHVGHGDGAEQGALAADAFSKRVRNEVLNWLEEVGLEGGLG